MNRGVYLLAVITMLSFFTIGCKRDKHKGDLQFYYYPEKNVYYDPLKKDFWYSLNGTKTWSTFTNTADSAPTTLGEKVIIYSANADVYKDNESHRKLYGGKLYSIIVTDTATAFAGAGREATERIAVQKRRPAIEKKPVTNKPKSSNSIGKFIDKIFRKHK